VVPPAHDRDLAEAFIGSSEVTSLIWQAHHTSRTSADIPAMNTVAAETQVRR
jgi:hypothetical protein